MRKYINTLYDLLPCPAAGVVLAASNNRAHHDRFLLPYPALPRREVSITTGAARTATARCSIFKLATLPAFATFFFHFIFQPGSLQAPNHDSVA